MVLLLKFVRCTAAVITGNNSNKPVEFIPILMVQDPKISRYNLIL